MIGENMELTDLYTYAFLETPHSPLVLPQGVRGPVSLVTGNQVSALVEPGISPAFWENDDEKIVQMALCHDRVICEMFEQVTVLPLRFGTCFDSLDNLLKHLAWQEKEYKSQLEKIRDKIELTLKLIPHTFLEPVVSEKGGRNYFLAKKQEYENQKTFVNSQNIEKQNLIDLITKEYNLPAVVQEQKEGIKIYVLININEKIHLEEKFLNWQRACPRWDLVWGDCLPPYHFIEH